MLKKKAAKSKATKVTHRHFRPSYHAHPVIHLSTAVLFVVLTALVLSYIVFAIQYPYLFR